MRVFTTGHSTRPIETLIDLLRAHDVRPRIDVGTVRRSRRHPQFERDALAASVADRAEPHAMTTFARVDAGRVTYPSTQPDLPLTDA